MMHRMLIAQLGDLMSDEAWIVLLVSGALAPILGATIRLFRHSAKANDKLMYIGFVHGVLALLAFFASWKLSGKIGDAAFLSALFLSLAGFPMGLFLAVAPLKQSCIT